MAETGRGAGGMKTLFIRVAEDQHAGYLDDLGDFIECAGRHIVITAGLEQDFVIAAAASSTRFAFLIRDLFAISARHFESALHLGNL
jgi:hypothetical protein